MLGGSPWPDSSVRIAPLSQLPWGEVSEDAVRSMLERHVRQRRQDVFGIYVGDSEAGAVQPLAFAH